MSKTLFLTGATGLVGGNLLQRILKSDPAVRVVALIRARSDVEAEQRLTSTLRRIDPEIDMHGILRRMEVLSGDITHASLRLSRSTYQWLASTTTHVIHCAANVEFNHPLEEARRVNVGGTKNVMALAQRAQQSGTLERFAYVSTAFVSGSRTGMIREQDLECGQGFSNTYEQSKYEAEQLMRRSMSELPITVFRPSIIVGDSATGRTTAFNVLYLPLKLICRGILTVLPGSRRTPMDVVPVNYVCDAISHIILCSGEGIGTTYHLTAGETSATAAGDIVDLAVDYFNQSCTSRRIQQVRFLPPMMYRQMKQIVHHRLQKLLQSIEVFLPYLSVGRTYDNCRAAISLSGTGISVPPYRLYYERLLRFCLDSQWGRNLDDAEEQEPGDLYENYGRT